jgi:hypothetical protein
MEINYDIKIENTKRKIKIKHLQELVKKLNSDGSTYHLNNLLKIVKSLKEKNDINHVEPIIEKKSTKTHLFNTMDQYMFNKPWNRLPEVHKLIKIKEYINKSLIIYDNEKKDELKHIMFDYVKTKKLTKKGSVNYDHVNGRILSIPNLKYNKNNEEYYLNL